MKRAARAKKKRGRCVITGCGREDAIEGRMCPRCQSWWRYHSLQSASEFSGYLGRVSLAGTRIQVYRAGNVVRFRARKRA